MYGGSLMPRKRHCDVYEYECACPAWIQLGEARQKRRGSVVAVVWVCWGQPWLRMKRRRLAEASRE